MKINFVQNFLTKDDGGIINQYLIVTAATIPFISVGIHQGWSGPSLIKLLSNEYPLPVSNEEASYITITGPVGHIMGGFLAMSLADNIGRKRTILSVGIPQFLSALLIYLSFIDKYLLYIARILGGIGEGASLTLIPCYIAEIVEPSVRGKLGSSVNLVVLLGQFFINLVGSFLNIHQAALICLIFPITFWITFSSMPESPYYCLMKKDFLKAEKSLQILRRKKDVEKEMLSLSSDVERQMSEKGTYKDLFCIKANRKAFLLATATRFFQIFTGSIALISYQQIMISQSTDISPVLGSTMLIAVSIIMVILASFYVDKFGRKPLMIISSGCTALTLLAQALFLTIRDYTSMDVSQIAWLPLVIMIIKNLAFRGGLGVVTNILISELYSTSIKAKAMSLGSINFACVVIITTKMYQYTADYIGLAIPFYIFGSVSVVGILFYYFFLPETKGKTLEAIQQELKDSKNVFFKG